MVKTLSSVPWGTLNQQYPLEDIVVSNSSMEKNYFWKVHLDKKIEMDSHAAAPFGSASGATVIYEHSRSWTEVLTWRDMDGNQFGAYWNLTCHLKRSYRGHRGRFDGFLFGEESDDWQLLSAALWWHTSTPQFALDAKGVTVSHIPFIPHAWQERSSITGLEYVCCFMAAEFIITPTRPVASRCVKT